MVDRSGDQATLTYDPGADAAHRFPDWVIRHGDLKGVPEVMCTSRKVILLEHASGRASRRCNLAHAVAHIDLSHQVAAGVLSTKQELAADKLAARRLIPISILADAALWAESFEELAAELDVDERMLWVRGRHLHPSEAGYLWRALESKQQTA